MRILVTGADGFIGRQVIPSLLTRGHEVVAMSIKMPQVSPPWMDAVEFIAHNINDKNQLSPLATKGVEAAIYLAWPRLPNYEELFHFEENLLAAYRLVQHLVEEGVGKVLVTGTCFEYGMRDGELSEDMPAAPDNPYALAKDTLRRFLEARQKISPFTLQ